MDNNGNRRKSKRHQISWKAAVLFDESDQRPTLYTQTNNLSIGGAAIVSDYADLTGRPVTLLLGLKSQSADAPKMLMLSAWVVSTARLPTEARYQHGLRFENLDEETAGLLHKLLETTKPAGGAEAASAQPPPAVPVTPGSARLAALRQRVLTMPQEQDKPSSKKRDDAKLSAAIEQAYRYLKEFADQLNRLKPAYEKPYAIAGVPKFDGLKWADGQVSFFTKEISPGEKRFERLALVFHLSAGKTLCVTREPPADEKLKSLLRDTKIEFTTKEERNDRPVVIKTAFEIPCEVWARLELIGNFETGKLLLKTRNIERFGMMDYELDPDAISDESLDELSGFILGETVHIGPLLLKK